MMRVPYSNMFMRPVKSALLNRTTHNVFMRTKHFLKAGYWRGHNIHSPFVYHIVRHVITTRSTDKRIKEFASDYRDGLLKDKAVLNVGSIGAIARAPRKRKVSNIAKQTSTSDKYGKMLARMAGELKPKGILELGTSLGMSAAYLALGCPTAKVVSLEGLREIADVASRHLLEAGLTNVEVRCCDIDEGLEKAISELPDGKVELAFIDANHNEEATMRYFETIVGHANEEMCLMIFDDIFWSDGMTRAWHKIISDERIMTTIELPRMGLAFIRTGCQKEHYTLRW